MRRLARLLLNALTSFSLLLCAATVVLWVRSYHPQPPPAAYADRWLYSRGYAATHLGEFTVVYFDPNHDPDRPFDYVNWRWRGFRFARSQGGSSWNRDWQYTSVGGPCWAPCLATAILPSLWLYRTKRPIRQPGNCPACGYDLRATPDRCPECGAVAGADQAGRSSGRRGNKMSAGSSQWK